MRFLRRNWFKLVIFLPFIPAGLFIYSIETFTGIDDSLRFLVSIIIAAATLLLLTFGLYLEFGKGQNHRFRIGSYNFGGVEIARFFFVFTDISPAASSSSTVS